jgi:hypothetical protein
MVEMVEGKVRFLCRQRLQFIIDIHQIFPVV